MVGIAAKDHLRRNKCYIGVPNKMIISVARAYNCVELKPWFDSNPQLFDKKHPDHE